MKPPRTRPLLLLLLLTASLGCATMAMRRANEAVDLTAGEPEVSLKFLTHLNGRLHRVGHEDCFTGWMIQHRPDGSLLSRSHVRHGVLDGLSEGWHPNGQIQVRESFTFGVSHGLRQKWYPDGRLLSEATIRRGSMEGVFRHWHDNGALAEEIPMHEGKPDGLSRAWYPSGCLKAEVRLVQGEIEEKRYWEDGAKVVSSPLAAVSPSLR